MADAIAHRALAVEAALDLVRAIHDARAAHAKLAIHLGRGAPEYADAARSLQRANDDADALLRVAVEGVE